MSDMSDDGDPTNESTDDDETPQDKEDRLSGHDIVRKGMVDLPRNTDGAVDGEQLLDYVADLIPFDVEAERRRKARRYIANERKHGGTDPDGVMHFDGIDPYDFEPDRLVMGDDGSFVENGRARPAHKSAEARRAMAKARAQMTQAERRQVEASNFADWFIDQFTGGAKAADLTFGAYKQWRDDNPLSA